MDAKMRRVMIALTLLIIAFGFAVSMAGHYAATTKLGPKSTFNSARTA
jgi:hypothetical protein